MFYFDNASTTKISTKSLNEYVKASEMFFNPSALYEQAIAVKSKIEEARQFFLNTLKGKDGATFIFTGSATESNNAVLYSNITRKDKKYLISAGEHSSVYETAKHLKEIGYNVVFIPLNKNGSINVDALKQELDNSVAFVSIINVSNETGAINDIPSISKLIKSYNKNIIIHSDGVQALGKINIDLKNFNIDYYTISAHKINGPKGIGGLYIANPNKFKPLILGGGQEMNMRSGTENFPAIMAFKQALKDLSFKNYSLYKQAFISNLKGDYILVSDEKCVDNIISLCFKGTRGETLEHILEEKGFIIGTGSACNSKAKINRVLQNFVPRDYISGAVRISFGSEITKEDCVNLAKELSKAAKDYKEKISK